MGVLITAHDAQPLESEAKRLAKNANRGFGYGEKTWTRNPIEYFVHIFTVSKRDFRTIHALYPQVFIPACAPTERYREAMIIPSPYAQWVDAMSVGNDPNDPPFKYHQAERIAQDICNPNNLSLEQDLAVNPETAISDGTNLTQHGVFWSKNATPTEEELVKAEARRNKFLESVMQKADRLYTENPGRLNDNLTLLGLSMSDVRTACDMFGIEDKPYYRKFVIPVDCPNCGEKVKSGVAFHKDADGDICVLDWKRTVAAGKKKKEDVPEEARWWKEGENVAEPVKKPNLEHEKKERVY